MDDNLELRFGATAAGVEPVTTGIIAQLRSIAATAAQISTQVGTSIGSFIGLGHSARGAGDEVKRMGDHGNVAANSFMGMLEQMEHVRRKVGEVAELFAAAFAVEQIAHGIERVVEWGEAHAAAAEHIEQEAQRLGISTTAIQQWNAVATMMGHTGDEFVSMFTRLERSFQRGSQETSQQAGAFRQLGIDATSARNPQELLLQIADRFHAMPDGPQKVAIAMALMGRSGADAIPILNQGRQALEDMMNTGRQYGVVMDESMIERNAEVARTLNTSKIAMEGLGNTLFTSLSPVLQDCAHEFNDLALQIVQSYREGGSAKVVFDALASTIRGIVVFIATFVSVIIAFFLYLASGVEGFVAVVQTGWEYVKSQCRQLEISFETLGHVIYDTLTNNIMAAAQHVQQGLADMNAEVAHSVQAMAGLANNPWMVSANRLSGAGDSVMRGAGQFMQHMVGPGKTGTATGHYGDRGTSMAVSRLGGGGGHHGRGESQVGQWEQELHQMEIASGEFFRDQTQTELAFWQQKLALTTEGSKAWYEVQTKIFTLSRSAAQQHYQEQISELDFEIQAQHGHFAQMAEIEARKVELVRTTYGEQSRQFHDVLREQLRMQQQHDQEMITLQMSTSQQRQEIDIQASQMHLQIQTDALGMERNMVEYAVSAGTMSRVEAARQMAVLDQQEYALQLQAANREYDMLMMGLQLRRSIGGLTEQQQQQLDAQIERAQADHYNRLEQMESSHGVKMQQDALATATAYQQTWLSRLQPIEQGLTQMVNGFLTSTQSMRSAILSFGSSILQAVNTWIIRWVTLHIAGEHAKTAATVAGNAARTAAEASANTTGMAMNAASATSEITTHAAVAAAGALRAVSHIPVIGPFIAPAIAAGILALAMSFISKVSSAEGGWGNVPMDGMMTELHKEEMVLPASIASPLRSVLAGAQLGLGPVGLGRGGLESARGLTGSDGTGAGGVRDVHFHVSAMDGRSVRRFLFDHKHNLAEALSSAARDANV